jgi:hypothetical protein
MVVSTTKNLKETTCQKNSFSLRYLTSHVLFEVVMGVSINIMVLWDMAPFSKVGSNTFVKYSSKFFCEIDRRVLEFAPLGILFTNGDHL